MAIVTLGTNANNSITDALANGESAPTVLNAANEEAVHGFLAEKVGFLDIPRIVEETLEKWGREETLGDIVRVIRDFRPDVILTLPLESGGGGQHHQAVAQGVTNGFLHTIHAEFAI